MDLNLSTSPHIHNKRSIAFIMLNVVGALIPGTIAYVWFFGWGIVINMILAVFAALVCEAIMLSLRKRPIKPFIMDGSAVVTALLLALAIPPIAPWWITVIGICFAIIIAKHLYGGLGFNPFNPAMIGYVMLLVSFPLQMTSWVPPQMLTDFSLGFKDTFIFIFSGNLPPGILFDTLTEATPLDALKSHLRLGNSVSEIKSQLGLDEQTSKLLSVIPIFGAIGGKGWEWISGGFLIGGLWLLALRIIHWQIPVFLFLSLSVVSALFFIINPEQFASPLFHLFSGATILGAFFIATDPVTAATTLRGKIVFAIGIGLLTYIIRTWGGYPDAIAFAVLLMNMTVPLIDTYFKPRVFGHK